MAGFPNSQSNPAGAIPVYFGATPANSAISGAPISFATSGDNVVVAAVAAKSVAVYRLYFTVASATNITIKDGAGNALTGAMAVASNGSFFFDLNGLPWWNTTAGNAFIINSSAPVQVSGRVEYTQS